MKYVNRLSVRIVIAVVAGFMLAGAGTKITYTCPPVDGAVGCTSLQKAIVHPEDLLNNKQESLVRFSETIVVTSLASFALFSAYTWFKAKKRT